MPGANDLLARQVISMILQDVPFPSPSSLFPGWSPSSLSSVLSSIPRYLLLPAHSLGRQSPALPFPTGKTPAGIRDFPDLRRTVRKALEFYSWAHDVSELAPSEPPCRAMARLLARARRLPLLWRFLHSHAGVVTTATVTDVLAALGEEGLADHALAAFYRMKQLRCKPDVRAYNVVIAALCAAGRMRRARALLERMELPGFRCPPDRYTYTVLIAAYCRRAREVGQRKAVRRRMWEANHMFRRMAFMGFEPDVVTYNCLIDGLCKTYRVGRAHEVFNEMLARGCQPNRVTYDSFVRYYCRVNEVDRAVEIMRDMEEKGHGEPSTSSYTPVIHTLCEVGRVKEAVGFLEGMVGRGLVPREYTYKLVKDAMAAFGEGDVRGEVRERIEEGIIDRRNHVLRFKPFLPRRNGYS